MIAPMRHFHASCRFELAMIGLLLPIWSAINVAVALGRPIDTDADQKAAQDYQEELRRIGQAIRAREARMIEERALTTLNPLDDPIEERYYVLESEDWSSQAAQKYDDLHINRINMAPVQSLHDSNSEEELNSTPPSHEWSDRIFVNLYEQFSLWLNKIVEIPFRTVSKWQEKIYLSVDKRGSQFVGLSY